MEIVGNGFLGKTYKIFDTPQYAKGGICGWSKDGTQIVIHDVKQFERLVLPNYFKHNNFNSFVRQLNMYDFHKVRLSSIPLPIPSHMHSDPCPVRQCTPLHSMPTLTVHPYFYPIIEYIAHRPL